MTSRPHLVFFVFWASLLLAITVGLPVEGMCAADTLTVIQRPIENIPALVVAGDTLPIYCQAGAGISGWAAELVHGQIEVPLQVLSSTYDASTLWWTISTEVPDVQICELYDLVVTADGGIVDTTKHSVRVIPQFQSDYYFIHITDTHLPTELYYYEEGADTDSSCIVDLREIIKDVNIINPEFVLLTGDFINEGDLEDFMSKHYFTRAQAMLGEFNVPVFLTSGNHDIGGYASTPVPAGTARRTWWKFFGWPRLDSPPSGAPWTTQNYSFNYGPVHYVGLEAYINYDGWRQNYYGGQSFTTGQLNWLSNDLAAAGSATKVLFYHSDFSSQINLTNLGAAMALSGHVHRDTGSITTPPYNLTTNNACNGERSYRLVRVTDGVVHPTGTITAGGSGGNLNVVFSPANDGTHSTVTANITNIINQRFEHSQLRFIMPGEVGSYAVTGGALVQVDSSGPCAVCYVGVDILAGSSKTVTVTLNTGASVPPGGAGAGSLWLAQIGPNPSNGTASITFGLPAAARVRLTVSDIQGRVISVLADETMSAGDHVVTWNGRDSAGGQVSPGIYFAQVSSGKEARIRKLLLVR
jgi:hypothetical protein